MANLGELYQSATGMTFDGEVVNHHNIRKTKVWTVIELTGGAQRLEKLLGKISQTAGERVWKGFTGPPDYDRYRIWVELKADVGVCGSFTVTGYKGPFRVDDPRYPQHNGYSFIVTLD